MPPQPPDLPGAEMSGPPVSHYEGFTVGHRVVLTCGCVDLRRKGPLLAPGTLGTVVGYARHVPQVRFDDLVDPVLVPPHFLDLVEVDIDAPDGTDVYSGDVIARLMRTAATGGAA